MPTTHDAGNGLTTFSAHAFEQATGGSFARFDEERAAYPGLVVGTESDVDPETAARRFLAQAMESSSMPSLASPVANGTASRFETISTQTLPLTGTRMVKFRQTLNRIPIYGSLVSVELGENNELIGIDSALGQPDGVDPVASISPAQASEATLTAPGGYRPTLDGVVPRLRYYFDKPASRWRLTYMLEDVPVRLDRSAETDADRGSDLEPPRFVDYVVDAHDGSVVAVLPRTPSLTIVEDEVQTAVDSFGVERELHVTRREGGFVLRDPVHNVETYDFAFGDPAVDGDQLPGAAILSPPALSPAAVSAHANAAAVSEFMRTVLRRNNIDDEGGTMASSVNCVVQDASTQPRQWINAFWNGRQMVYGQVIRGDQLLSLSANVDVVGHEMFHGVTQSTSRLEYVSQSGALNESYSDIFGTIIANWGNEDTRTWDWELGEKLLPGDRPFRDLSDPAKFGQPAHMDDYRVLPETRSGDWGGVHTNSGIPNKAAYNVLTAENPDGALTLSVAEAAAVFYLALTQRLSRTSQFVDSRQAAVASARTLFRNLPADQQESKVAAVEAAFDAVGIS